MEGLRFDGCESMRVSQGSRVGGGPGHNNGNAEHLACREDKQEGGGRSVRQEGRSATKEMRLPAISIAWNRPPKVTGERGEWGGAGFSVKFSAEGVEGLPSSFSE